MDSKSPTKAIVTRGRRRRPGAAAAAYSHALAITRSPQLAETIAVEALRKGAHSRMAVLAHARHRALQAPAVRPTDPASPAAEDVRTVAGQLADSRPPVERAIVDLELRYGLDFASFARALGLPAPKARTRAEGVAKNWADSLDPAMMGWLGPGACGQLAGILTTARVWPRSNDPLNTTALISPATPASLLPTGTDAAEAAPASEQQAQQVTIAELLKVAPVVLDHSKECEVCAERLRMMTPVRTLIGQTPPEEVPSAVGAAARASRRRLAGPLPPSIEPRRLDVSRGRSLAGAAAAGAGVLAIGWFGISALTTNEETQAERVNRLVNSAPPSRLLATPTVVNASTSTAALANNGDAPILWHAETSASWLRVEPADGRLAPSQTVSIGLTADPPSGTPSEAVITVTGSDGSRQTLRYDGDAE